MKIDVLDKGYVRLVESMGNDLSIVRSARVSFDADWRDPDKSQDRKLIRYLIKHEHTSPFEAVEFTFEVKAPIFVLRQWHRHRSWSYNEVSARYTELGVAEIECYVPDPKKVGVQSVSNRQARIINGTERAGAVVAYTKAIHDAGAAYRQLLDDGVPRELARCVLPLATYSRMFAKVDLHNLLHFIRLREAPDAQYEIQQYAKALKAIARTVVPITMEELDAEESKA